MDSPLFVLSEAQAQALWRQGRGDRLGAAERLALAAMALQLDEWARARRLVDGPTHDGCDVGGDVPNGGAA